MSDSLVARLEPKIKQWVSTGRLSKLCADELSTLCRAWQEEQGKEEIVDIPRRIRIDQFTPAEKAIYDAVQAVEALPADVRLTDAVILLQKAREKVADFVDGVSLPAAPTPTEESR